MDGCRLLVDARADVAARDKEHSLSSQKFYIYDFIAVHGSALVLKIIPPYWMVTLMSVYMVTDF